MIKVIIVTILLESRAGNVHEYTIYTFIVNNVWAVYPQNTIL